jgi:hypothetical protein
MSFAPGTRLGPYEIVAKLGAGGMGEVYRARDTQLDRNVAIKVLPESFAADADRVARFTREAKTLASLNHPNIAAIYAVEPAGSVPVLVMELVDGEDLSETLARGPLAVADAVPMARQIADALEAAHEQGIVHRDLKPANIKVRADGTVKVLDFGLAKAGGPTDPSGAALANSPTLTARATEMGMILGTAAYMAPEQARGRAIDKRADIWAFGCVLYEMLTGHRAFKGDDVTETLASVIKDTPDLSALPTSLPPALRALVERCLERDPRMRLRDIGEARVALERLGDPRFSASPAHAAAAASSSILRQPLPLAIGAALVVVAAFGWLRRQPASDTPPVVLSVLPPAGAPLSRVGSMASAPLISPDGSTVLFQAGKIYVRRLDSLETVAVPGSERATNAAFWGPDSASVFYPVNPDGLIRVRLPGGAPERVMPISGPSRSGTVHADGAILLSGGQTAGTLLVLDSPGGTPRRVDLSAVGSVDALYPEFLPDSRDFLFLAQPRDGGAAAIYLATLDRDGIRNPVRLMENGTAAHYTPAGGGQLLFVRNDNLYAQHLDMKGRRLTGDPTPIQDGIGSSAGGSVNLADFSVSRSGTIAWRPGIAAVSQVTAFDRSGAPRGTSGPPITADSLDLSPDGTRLLAFADTDAWLIDVGQPGVQTLPFGSKLWFADGARILGDSGGRVWERPVTGGQARDLGEDLGQLHALSPDGTRSLVFGSGGTIIQALGSSGASAPPVFVPGGSFGDCFSPDGHWVAYSWGDGVFVQPFPGPGLRRQIASGARSPRWRADGAEIMALAADGTGVVTIPVERRGPEPQFGTPTVLFRSVLRVPSTAVARSVPLAVSRDGSTIYWLQGVQQPGPDAIHVRTQAIR